MFRKRVALGLVAVAILALVSGVYAYWRQSNQPQSLPITSTITSDPFELITELNKTEFQQGEIISVKVRLRNISNQTIAVGWTSSYHFDFNITDESDNLVYQWSRNFAFILNLPSYTLRPGGEVYRNLESLVPDFVNNRDIPPQLPKGTYRLVGFTNNFTASFKNPDELIGYGIVLSTPLITITVT